MDPQAKQGLCTPWHLIPQLRETRAVLLDRNQPERRRSDLPRQQWLPRTKRDRANVDDHLVEQSGVVELSHQPATTDQPEILPLRSCQLLAQNTHPYTPTKEHGKACLERGCERVQGAEAHADHPPPPPPDAPRDRPHVSQQAHQPVAL